MNRMANVTGFCALIMLLVAFPIHDAHQQSYSPGVMPSRSAVPITYTANLGQLDERVSFHAEAGDVTLYFHPDGVTHLFLRNTDRPAEAYEIPFADEIDLPDKNFIRGNEKEITVTRTRFVDANPDPDIVGINRQAIVRNYFTGNDPSSWRTSVPCYSAILYKDIYPGIDLKYHSQGHNVKYDYIVHPGGDISEIKIRYEGMEALAVTSEGKLRFENNVGSIEEGLPSIFQEIQGKRVELAGRYVIRGTDAFGFALDDSCDPTLPVIVDPLLSHCNYLGGSLEDWGYCVTTGPGIPWIYVAGHTWSPNFPTDAFSGPYNGSVSGDFDAFLSIYDPFGMVLISSTYIGGSGDDWGLGLAVDANDDVYIAGTTSSSDFPIPDGSSGSLSGIFDGFVAKLTDTGTVLDYSTYVGGSSYDVCNDLAVDDSYRAYVTGMTYSSNFPGTGGEPQPKNAGYWDAFVTRLHSSGNIDTSTYLGGSSIETSYGIALGTDGVYITGWTWSKDFPVTTDVFQDFRYGPQDVFVAKLAPDLNALTYSTYIGGDSKDYGKDIAVDGGDSAYITGWTQSTDFPADNDTLGATDAFVTKLNTNGSDIVYSRLLGGERNDRGYGIAVDDSLRAYVTGRTESEYFETAGTFSIAYTGTDSSDAFFARLNDAGNSLTFSTCLGDTTSGAREGNDMGYGICVWSPPVFPVQIAYVTGKTDSDDLPNSFFTDYGGNYDAFLAMFAAADIEFPTAEIDSIVPDEAQAGVDVHFWGTGSHSPGIEDTLNIITYRWESDIDGLFSNAAACTTSTLSIGTHQISFMAQDTLFLWSPVVLDTVIITDPANPPTAVIDSIKPKAVRVGDPVYFGGHGDDLPPGWIVEYLWTSNIDDAEPLSEDSAFDTTGLSPGVHTISFWVKDNEGNWSTPVTEEVYVGEAGEELWEISWWYPDYVDEFSLLMHDHYSCTLFVTNISQNDQEFNFRIDTSFLDYRWDPSTSRADPPDGLGLEKTCTLNDTADYPWGNLLAENIAAGETKRYIFATSNDWTWIPDWSLLNTVSMVLSFVPMNYIPSIVEVASYLVGYRDYKKAPVRIEYTYELMGDAAVTGLPDRVDTVYVRPEKMKHYKRSMFLAFVGARFSQAGWAALVKILPPAGPIIAGVCFVVEAIFYAGSYLYYQSALDPQTDYTQYDNPRKPADIECYATAHSQQDNCYKYMTYRAMEQYAYAEALLGSYGKCVGALKANSVEWAAKQMAISYCYMDKATSNLDEINEFSHGLISNIPTPDAVTVEDIRDSLEVGLPPIEVDIMGDLGQDPATMADSFLAEYNAPDWETFAASYIGLTDTVSSHISAASQLMDSLYAEGLQGAVLGRVVQVKPDVIVQGAIPAPVCTLWVEFPGLMFPISSYSFDSASMSATNDNSSSSEKVSIANIGVEDTDGDFVPELKIFFTAHMDSVGYRLESVYGDIITPSGDTLPDTLPFSTAAVIKVLSSSVPSNFSGCVMETESFEPVESVQVRVCADSLFIVPPIYTDVTDSAGRYSFDGKPDGNYYAEFTSTTHTDTTHGPVSISAKDTTKVCMLVEAIPGCCVGKTGNVDGDEGDIVDIGDLTSLIDYLFINFKVPECMEEANADGEGDVDIGDLTALIDFLFISFTPTADCP